MHSCLGLRMLKNCVAIYTVPKKKSDNEFWMTLNSMLCLILLCKYAILPFCCQWIYQFVWKLNVLQSKVVFVESCMERHYSDNYLLIAYVHWIFYCSWCLINTRGNFLAQCWFARHEKWQLQSRYLCVFLFGTCRLCQNSAVIGFSYIVWACTM